jgi:hypothetical protein
MPSFYSIAAESWNRLMHAISLDLPGLVYSLPELNCQQVFGSSDAVHARKLLLYPYPR